MSTIQDIFLQKCNEPSDINEHLPVLAKYASECTSVLELGVRGCISSWAFAHGLKQSPHSEKTLILNDIEKCDVVAFEEVCKNEGISVQSFWMNDLDLKLPVYSVDLTFIDTWHVYAQLKRELYKFSQTTNKYIIMHDTTIDGIQGESIRLGSDIEKQSIESGFLKEEICCGLKRAIVEFTRENPNWEIHEEFTNNNGLTILKKIENNSNKRIRIH